MMNKKTDIIQPVDGIQIIDDITNQFGVETLEGTFGPLMMGVGSQAHFIELTAGSFTPEHPHSNESIIFTVRGRWVLCSGGERHLMQPNSLFWFGPDVSTGYEVPFDEPAFLLIFKGMRLHDSAEKFIDYLANKMKPHLEEEAAAGTMIFRLDELPADHPARVFGREVNDAAA